MVQVTEEFKQEPHRWAWHHNMQILDPDGWRVDGKDFHEPITEAEFLERVLICTVMYAPDQPLW